MTSLGLVLTAASVGFLLGVFFAAHRSTERTPS